MVIADTAIISALLQSQVTNNLFSKQAVHKAVVSSVIIFMISLRSNFLHSYFMHFHILCVLPGISVRRHFYLKIE